MSQGKLHVGSLILHNVGTPGNPDVDQFHVWVGNTGDMSIKDSEGNENVLISDKHEATPEEISLGEDNSKYLSPANKRASQRDENEGMGFLRVTYSFEEHGGTLGDKILGTLPAGASIVQASWYVLQPFAGGAGARVGAGIAVDYPEEIMELQALDINQLDVQGFAQRETNFSSVQNAKDPITQQRDIILRIDEADLTQGRIHFYLHYYKVNLNLKS